MLRNDTSYDLRNNASYDLRNDTSRNDTSRDAHSINDTLRSRLTASLYNPTCVTNSIPLKRPYVGCTIPDFSKGSRKWAKFNAHIYTDKTKHNIKEPHVGARAHKSIPDECTVTIIPESDAAEFNPPCKKGILWVDDFIAEAFHVRFKPGYTEAEITVSFFIDEVAVAFGEVILSVSFEGNSKQHVKQDTICLLYDQRDSDIAEYISGALKQVNELVSDPHDSSKVQLLYSSHTSPSIVKDAMKFSHILAVTYWEKDIDLSIWLEEGIPVNFYSNNIDKLLDMVQDMKQDITKSLERLITLTTASFEAICESATNQCPRAFHVWPSKKPSGFSRLNPKNWVMYRYKLHLLCEGAYDYTGSVDDYQHYVFETHSGYKVDVPTEWFHKWGPLLSIATKLICIASKIGITLIGVGSLADMIPEGLPLDKLNDALPILNIVSHELVDKDLGTVVMDKAKGLLDDMETTLKQEGILNTVKDGSESFNELQSFLVGREPLPEFAGLERLYHLPSMPKGGKVTWVCPHHAKIIREHGSGRQETLI